MEQKNKNDNNQPKMPRFNMSWIYMLALIALIAIYFSSNGQVGGSATRPATYDSFRIFVDKGYATKVVVNSSERRLKMYVNPKTYATCSRPRPRRWAPTRSLT